MSGPRVSVVIPVYNGAADIGATIESVLAQTWTDFELIVMDNASTDGTRDVVRRFRDPRLRLVENAEHVGPGPNFNRALSAAQGEFVKLLPADDVLHPTCLERQVAVLADPRQAGVVLVACGRDVIGPEGARILTPRVRLAGRIAGGEAIRRTMRAGANLLGEPLALLFRRSVLPQVGGFDGTLPFMLDVDMWMRMLRHGDLYFIPESLGAFRISRRTLSFSLTGRQSSQFRALIRRLRGDPAYGLSRADALLGSVRCTVREVLRTGVYWFYLRK